MITQQEHTMFPYLSLFLVFLNSWLAVSPWFRGSSHLMNYAVFYVNLVAAVMNLGLVLFWVFNWMTA